MVLIVLRRLCNLYDTASLILGARPMNGRLRRHASPNKMRSTHASPDRRHFINKRVAINQWAPTPQSYCPSNKTGRGIGHSMNGRGALGRGKQQGKNGWEGKRGGEGINGKSVYCSYFISLSLRWLCPNLSVTAQIVPDRLMDAGYSSTRYSVMCGDCSSLLTAACTLCVCRESEPS